MTRKHYYFFIILIFLLFINYVISNDCVNIDNENVETPIYQIETNNLNVKSYMLYSVTKNVAQKFIINNRGEIYLRNRLPQLDYVQKLLLGVIEITQDDKTEANVLCFTIPQTIMPQLVRRARQVATPEVVTCNMLESDITAQCITTKNTTGSYYYHFNTCENPYLNINITNGILTPKSVDSLNYETMQHMNVFVDRYASSTNISDMSINITITIIDRNDEPPVFQITELSNPVRISLFNGAATVDSTLVFNAKATDPDNNSLLMYSISSTTEASIRAKFNINSGSGELFTIGNSFTAGEKYSIVIRVVDVKSENVSKGFADLLLIVHVDEIPIQFTKSLYNFAFESSFSGDWNKSIGQVKAYDPKNLFNRQTLQLNTTLFTIDSTGNIYFKQTINLNVQRFWYFTASLINNTLLKSLVTVTVKYSKTALQFRFANQAINVNESEICAKSLDLIYLNDWEQLDATLTVNYNSSSSEFYIGTDSNKNGVLYTKRSFDYETMNIYEKYKTIEVYILSVTTTVTVSINNIDDNPLEFCSDNMTVSVPENSVAGYIVFQSASCDRDLPTPYYYFYENNKVVLEYDIYQINSESGMITLKSTPRPNTAVSLTLIVSLCKSCTNCAGTTCNNCAQCQPANMANMSLILKVTKYNKHTPKFTCSESIEVIESDSGSVPIINATDGDGDSISFKFIENAILSSDLLRNFTYTNNSLHYNSIDVETPGWLSVFHKAFATVEVSDNGIPPYSLICHTKLNIKNIDDNGLVFWPSHQRILISTSNLESAAIYVYAEDRDDLINNEPSLITYKIIQSANFVIVKELYWGKITISNRNFRESETFQVQACNTTKCITSNITVEIKDITAVNFTINTTNSIITKTSEIISGYQSNKRISEYKIYPDFIKSYISTTNTDITLSTPLNIVKYLVVRVTAHGENTFSFQDRLIFVKFGEIKQEPEALDIDRVKFNNEAEPILLPKNSINQYLTDMLILNNSNIETISITNAQLTLNGRVIYIKNTSDTTETIKVVGFSNGTGFVRYYKINSEIPSFSLKSSLPINANTILQRYDNNAKLLDSSPAGVHYILQNHQDLFYVHPGNSSLRLLKTPPINPTSYNLSIVQISTTLSQQGFVSVTLLGIPNFNFKLSKENIVFTELTTNNENLNNTAGDTGVQYSLMSDPDSSLFLITNNVLKNNGILKRDFPDGKKTYYLTIKMQKSQPSYTAYSNVNVEVTDTNNNGPIFRPINQLQFIEGGQTSINPSLTVSDPDNPPNNNTVFTTTDGTISISKSGEISRATKNQIVAYNPLQLTSFYYPLSATQTSFPVENTEAEVFVTSGYSNYIPKFLQTEYTISVNPNQVGSVVTTLMVAEPIPGLLYTMSSSQFFRVETNSELYSANILMLKNFTGSSSFTVTATYKSSSATTTVTFTSSTSVGLIPFDIAISNIIEVDEELKIPSGKPIASVEIKATTAPLATVTADIPSEMQPYIQLTKIDNNNYRLIQYNSMPRSVLNPKSQNETFNVTVNAKNNLSPFEKISRSINFSYVVTKFQPQLSISSFTFSEDATNVKVIDNAVISDNLFPNTTVSVKTISTINPNYWEYFTLATESPNKFSLTLSKSIDRETFMVDKEINNGVGYLPLEVTSNGQTSTTTLSFTVRYLSKSPISPGYSDVTAYTFEWWNYSYTGIEENIGRMKIITKDFDFPDVKFTKQPDIFTDGSFKVAINGYVTMTPFLSEGKYSINAKASNATTTVDSTMLVTVQKLSFNGIQNSVVLRLSNINCAEFILRRNTSSTDIKAYNNSMMENIREKIASIISKPVENIFLKCINEGSYNMLYADILIASRGSPFIKKSKLQNDIQNSLPIINSILPSAKQIVSAPLDLCATEQDSQICSTGCKNLLTLNGSLPFSDMASLKYSKVCGCSPTAIKYNCSNVYACYNKGNCTNNLNSDTFACSCLPGFDGPRCQGLSVGLLSVSSYSWTSENFGSCKSFDLTISIISGLQSQTNAQILFVGPSLNFTPNAADFLSLKLMNSSNLNLHVNLGSQIFSLSLNTDFNILNGSWQIIEMGLKENKLYLMINRCQPTKDVNDPFSIQSSNCYVETTITGSSSILNAAVYPIHLGGLKSPPSEPYFSNSAFIGTIKSVRLNGELMDIDISNLGNNNGVAKYSSEMENSCKNAANGDLCGSNGHCWGKWNGLHGSGECECKIGFFQVNQNSPCDSNLDDTYINSENTVSHWSLKDIPNFNVDTSTDIGFNFRTFKDTGTLLYLQGYNDSYYLNETIKLHLDKGKLILTFNLGGYEIQQYEVGNRNLNNGQWNSIEIKRILNSYEILINNGEFEDYFIRKLILSEKYNLIPLKSGKVTIGVQKDALPLVNSAVTNTLLLSTSCFKDVTIQMKKISISATNDAAVLTPSANPTSCPATATCSLACPSNQTCKGSYENQVFCACSVGFSIGTTCLVTSKCHPNPCNSNGVCYIKENDPGYFCLCPNGFVGPTCDVSIAAIIVPIITVLVLIIIILILLLLARRKRQSMLPGDDERENIISYNESAGEVDNKSFDLSKLEKALNYPSATVNTPTALAPYLTNEKVNAEIDPGGYPNDYPLDYGFEGGGSDVDDKSEIGSLSVYSSMEED